ncbi:MAG: sugar ABC transporter permease, partial [Clostridia bacterium]|nr:sugar ABC transporter permease [Clostridia bacterium]
MKNKNKGSLSSFSYNAPFIIMVIPFVLIMTIFVIVPAIGGVITSFTNFNGLTFPQFTGIENYTRLIFRDETFIVVFKNTLLQALIVGPVGFLLSFVVAWLINELDKNLRLLIIFLFYSPSFSGTLFVIWKYVF